ncbi:unnamed protein product [Adineta steineri]|uniref:ubiquitinyl hydrolase 1 n=1 Tax=Adineta steineri TaxID=433720 RepID=A0A813S0U3_9BILA|nr:unnamed protein product [Adineta steineri]
MNGSKQPGQLKDGYTVNDIKQLVKDRFGSDNFRLIVNGQEIQDNDPEKFAELKQSIKNNTVIYVCQRMAGGSGMVDIESHKATILVDLQDELHKISTQPNNSLMCLTCKQVLTPEKFFKTPQFIQSVVELHEPTLMARYIDFQICTCGAFSINSTMFAKQKCDNCKRWFCFFCNSDWDEEERKMCNEKYTCKVNCFWETKISYQLVTLAFNESMQVPNRRCCPKCFECGSYDEQCKYHKCKCGHTFCFICLKSEEDCRRDFNSTYNQLCGDVAQQSYTIFPRLCPDESIVPRLQYVERTVPRLRHYEFIAPHLRHHESIAPRLRRDESTASRPRHDEPIAPRLQHSEECSKRIIPVSTSKSTATNLDDMDSQTASTPFQLKNLDLHNTSNLILISKLSSLEKMPSLSPSNNLKASTNNSSLLSTRDILGVCGLNNIGNTCYMNSAIQCLNSISHIVEWAMNQPRSSTPKNIIDIYASLVQSMWSGHYTYVTPQELKGYIGRLAPIFSNYGQKDSHEFMNFLLTELQTVGSTSFFTDLFQIHTQSKTTCDKCQHHDSIEETSTFLPLPVPQLKSHDDAEVFLEDLISDFCQEDSLDGQYYCQKCKTCQSARHKTTIIQPLPRALIIQLQRFPFDGTTRKINTYVQYKLEYQNLLSDNDRYELYAVSMHSGSLAGGHYTTTARNYKNDQWYLFDDRYKEQINPESILISFKAQEANEDSMKLYIAILSFLRLYQWDDFDLYRLDLIIKSLFNDTSKESESSTSTDIDCIQASDTSLNSFVAQCTNYILLIFICCLLFVATIPQSIAAYISGRLFKTLKRNETETSSNSFVAQCINYILLIFIYCLLFVATIPQSIAAYISGRLFKTLKRNETETSSNSFVVQWTNYIRIILIRCLQFVAIISRSIAVSISDRLFKTLKRNKTDILPPITSENKKKRKKHQQKSNKPGLCGLTNIGNTCYMNSAIQCLSNIPKFTKWAQAQKLPSDQITVTQAYTSLIESMWSGDKSCPPTNDIKQRVSQHAPIFWNYAQKDSHEFMNSLLNALHTELKQNNSSKKQSSIVTDLFRIRTESAVTCLQCGTRDANEETTYCLPLSLGNESEVSLNKLVNDFLKEEELDGLYYCSKCQVLQSAKQKTSICHPLPPVIIVQLKRFTFDETNEKLNALVKYPLENWKVLNDDNSLYDLVAVSMHAGNLKQGHYTTYAKNDGDKAWYSFNDDRICEITDEKDIITKNAYILVYVKQV